MATVELDPILASPHRAPHLHASHQDQLTRNLARVVEEGPAAIEQRLESLSWEWSSGRLAKIAIGFVILTGAVLSVYVSPWFMIVPALGGMLLVQFFFAPKSWVGEIFHSMGYRRRDEIEQERLALRALRGDFRNIPTIRDIEDCDALSRMEGEGGGVVSGDGDSAKVDPREAVSQVVHAVSA